MLVHGRNNEGETPLFLADLYGQKETFVYLDSVASNKDTTLWRRDGGESILHCTIRESTLNQGWQEHIACGSAEQATSHIQGIAESSGFLGQPADTVSGCQREQYIAFGRQYVKNLVPEHLIFQTNKDDKIPGDIFDETHEKLVQDGSKWLKSTSESCSLVTALIVGVSFATSSSVPGGTNDETGKPTLKGQPAFNMFAITSLVALSFSITALVMFLAILTSCEQPKDFRRDFHSSFFWA
ncbi:hypothetical protein L6164_034510 [Bauhinia variegata]|uniref:Uncharacterized protein n=1 Tax=Bauhinia variegata TaxID=167791 RepID=A0ACB9KVH3_BAUVA|nr:hypothetical protein L6164_034510 [Bauhinia variegata]